MMPEFLNFTLSTRFLVFKNLMLREGRELFYTTMAPSEA